MNFIDILKENGFENIPQFLMNFDYRFWKYRISNYEIEIEIIYEENYVINKIFFSIFKYRDRFMRTHPVFNEYEPNVNLDNLCKIYIKKVNTFIKNDKKYAIEKL